METLTGDRPEDITQADTLPAPTLRTLIAASTAGTAFEWYDFFVFVPLATILAKVFFSGLSEAAALVFALGSFAAGFAFRPLGAVVFGRLGDMAGRKKTFLATISLMAMATFTIGLLPSYEEAGIIAPSLFIVMRLLQGLALGGEFTGAAIYVGEHSPAARRGFLTAWIPATAVVGLFAAMAVTLAARSLVGEDAFVAWGWRIPFLFSVFLFGISLWIRLKLSESPTFLKMKEEGTLSRSPFTDSFLRWPNLRLCLIGLFSVMMGQGAIWYTTFFYSQFFMEHVLKVPPALVNALILAATVTYFPLCLLFGWLSDKMGRKPIMIAGLALGVVSVFPAFHAMTVAANPALAAASAASPVTVTADPDQCSVQFDPVGKARFASPCDLAKSTLTKAGVPYTNRPARADDPVIVSVGAVSIQMPDGRGLDAKRFLAIQAQVDKSIGSALRSAGYLRETSAESRNVPALAGVLCIFILATAMLVGPLGAFLVELYPARVRYTAFSLPYNIGTGWVGGILPATATAMVAASGNIYQGLWYPFGITMIAIVIAVLFLPETRGRSLEF